MFKRPGTSRVNTRYDMNWKLPFASLVAAISSPLLAQESPPDPAIQREIEWMSAVVQQLRSSLVDPSSAQITLPFGFTPQQMTWKVWGVDMTGYFTCGVVNSRNRMGGYVGQTVFLAYISPEGQVSVTLDDPSTAGQRYGGLMMQKTCEAKRQQGLLPTIRPETLAALSSPPAATATSSSVSEELEKLARMRAGGSLSEEEFTAAKARVLAGTSD